MLINLELQKAIVFNKEILLFFKVLNAILNTKMLIMDIIIDL